MKPYRPGDKTTPNDAAAICEAVSRPHMRLVAIKRVEQQDMQALHRIREPLVKDRTALGNHIRGVLAEYGVVIPPGSEPVGQALPGCSKMPSMDARRSHGRCSPSSLPGCGP